MPVSIVFQHYQSIYTTLKLGLNKFCSKPFALEAVLSHVQEGNLRELSYIIGLKH